MPLAEKLSEKLMHPFGHRHEEEKVDQPTKRINADVLWTSVPALSPRTAPLAVRDAFVADAHLPVVPLQPLKSPQASTAASAALVEEGDGGAAKVLTDADGQTRVRVGEPGAELEAIVRSVEVAGPTVTQTHVEQPVIHETHIHKDIVHEHHINQDVIHEKHVEQPIVHETHIEKPVIVEKHIEKPVIHEKHYERPIIHERHIDKPIVHEQHIVVPVIHEQHIVKPIIHEVYVTQPVVQDVVAAPPQTVIDTTVQHTTVVAGDATHVTADPIVMRAYEQAQPVVMDSFGTTSIASSAYAASSDAGSEVLRKKKSHWKFWKKH